MHGFCFHPPPRTCPISFSVRPRSGTILLAVLALATFAAVFVINRVREAAAATEAMAVVAMAAAERVDPLQVLSLARSMKLVTVEIVSSITVKREDDSWRGDIEASVKTPVRLHYGIDLSKLEPESIAIGSPVDGVGVLVVRVPRPTRVAAEIIAGEEVTSVDVGWGRTRSRAGEYYLGLARRDLPEELQKLTLTAEQQKQVDRESLERVHELITRIVGGNIKVVVGYE
jgi:hypothetical protein